jgi:cell division protein FtsB
MGGSRKDAVPQKQYELGSNPGNDGFPLDGVQRGNLYFIVGMARAPKTIAAPVRHGTAMRLLLSVVGGWRRWATVAAAVLAIGLGYHVVFGQNGLTAYEHKTHDARALDDQLKSLQHENELLKGHVDRLQNDPNAIEHQAREELHYTRPGEVIYTLPVPSGSAAKDSKK